MNIEELESVVDAMAEECGDQIDALYDTITLQKDTYNGFICRLREVVRLAKNEQKKSAPVGDMAAMHEALDGMMYEAFFLCDSGIPPVIERGKLLARWCDKLRAAMPNQFTSPTAGRAGSAETAEAKGSTSTGNSED